MILERLEIPTGEVEQATGWTMKPQGACRDDRCVPLPKGAASAALFDLRVLADRLGMALVLDEETGLWALGPESGGRALVDAKAPDFTLLDWHGEPFTLSSLRGSKVLLIAWASW